MPASEGFVSLCIFFLLLTGMNDTFILALSNFWPAVIYFCSMYAFLAFDNQHLQFLWDWSQHNLTIHTGKLFFGRNPNLCMSEIRKMWLKTGFKEKFVEDEFRTNGGRANCKSLN